MCCFKSRNERNMKIAKKAIIWGRTGFDGEEVNLA